MCCTQLALPAALLARCPSFDTPGVTLIPPLPPPPQMQEAEARQRCQERLATQPRTPAPPSAAASDAASSPASSPCSTPTGGKPEPPSPSPRLLAVQSKAPSKALSFGRKVSKTMVKSGLAGPDTSSWDSLWECIMDGTLGHQAMPLLQVWGRAVELTACGAWNLGGAAHYPTRTIVIKHSD